MRNPELRFGLAAFNLVAGTALAIAATNHYKPEFPESLSAAARVREVVDLNDQAIRLCENSGQENPYRSLEAWLPTRKATLEKLGLDDESYNYCDGPSGESMEPKHFGGIAFSEGVLHPKWTLIEHTGDIASFATHSLGFEPVVHRVNVGPRVQEDSLSLGSGSEQ